jgi:hypothetical protein
LGASQFRFAQKGKGDLQPGGIVRSIFILERVVWPCLAPDISDEMVGMQVEIASGIDEGKIELTAFFGHLGCYEFGNEERMIARICRINEGLELLFYKSDGGAAIDRFDLGDEELRATAQLHFDDCVSLKAGLRLGERQDPRCEIYSLLQYVEGFN